MIAASASSQIRLRYGRHETFAIRYGWLGKGLSRMRTAAGGYRADLETADALGLGSKMVKSLAYWLEASGLAAADATGRGRQLIPSELGDLIAAQDPYFEYPATWWFVHAAVAGTEGSVFSWFFNDYAERSFERFGCVESFLRYARERTRKPPSAQVAQRDVACLLTSYATEVGARTDPEDGTVCPFNDLRLVLYHADTRRFEKSRPLDRVPIEAFLATAAAAAQNSGTEAMSPAELAACRFGPGRLFNMTGDMIDAAASEAAGLYSRQGVTFHLLGAERRLRVPSEPASYWLACHYNRIAR